MERGANVWANPVSYDKLAVRYRRWRNSMEVYDARARTCSCPWLWLWLDLGHGLRGPEVWGGNWHFHACGPRHRNMREGENQIK